jgi:hypothetical protein
MATSPVARVAYHKAMDQEPPEETCGGEDVGAGACGGGAGAA